MAGVSARKSLSRVQAVLGLHLEYMGESKDLPVLDLCTFLIVLIVGGVGSIGFEVPTF